MELDLTVVPVVPVVPYGLLGAVNLLVGKWRTQLNATITPHLPHTRGISEVCIIYTETNVAGQGSIEGQRGELSIAGQGSLAGQRENKHSKVVGKAGGRKGSKTRRGCTT